MKILVILSGICLLCGCTLVNVQQPAGNDSRCAGEVSVYIEATIPTEVTTTAEALDLSEALGLVD
jgi:hypothetical protein